MPTVAAPLLMMDPGYLWIAPAATAFPALGGTAVASAFTDAPSATFIAAGATEEGHTLSYSQNVEPVTVAEFADPITWRTTSRQGSWAMSLADYTLANLARAMNGGTTSTASGSGATLVSKWVPPVMGSEVRRSILWQSFDGTMRVFMYQCINVAEIESAFKKAPDKALLPCEFRFEVDSSSRTFEVYTAGTARLGL